MPNVWVAAFNVKGIFSFNFRNTVNGTAANGYTLAFSGTTLTLKYNDATLATSTNIPNLDTTYGEVYVTFEKQYISVTIDGTIYLSYKDNVVRPALEGEFINFFNTSGLRLSNIKIVAGNWISDGTSNIFLMGGNLNVNEDALISSNLTVTGNALISSNLFITGDINLTGNLKQNGSIFQAEGAWTKTGDNISYTTGNVSVGKDITVTGSVTSTTSLTSNVVTIGTTKTFVVTAAGGAFYIDGIIRKPIKLHQHQTYIFDLSSSTLLNNPFIFSESNNFDGTTSGTPYTTGITSTGTKRTFVVSASTPTTLYYYSTNTTLMGATVSISSTAELVVSGRVESTDLTLTGTGSLIVPSGTTAQRPVTAENGMIRYNSTTGSVEAYTTSSGWGAISAPPSITSVSPISVQGAHTGTQTFVVQGTGINTGSTVELEGVDGNRYSVFNTTTPAAAGYQISFQMGVFGAANGYDPLQAPYKIRIANSEGVAALGTATISLDAPTITGLSNNNLLTSATGSQVITLTGTGFTSSMTGTDKVLVLGVDGSTLYTVDSVTIVSSTSLTFKLSATGVVLSSAQLANKPYKVRITGIFGNTVTGTDTINLLPPTITSLSNNTLTDGTAGVTGSHIITVTGTGFTSSMTGTDKVQVLGVDGTTLYSVDSVTIDSLTSLTFKLAASGVAIPSPQLANRPYKVKLTGNAGLTVTSTQTIGFSGISWTSPAAGATLAAFNTGASVNNTELAATDDVGGSGVTFSVPANNLPSSLTLNPTTGAITGIIGAAGTTSVTFRVTDNVTGTFAERTFSIVGLAELYAFTTHTFNTGGSPAATGSAGPTLTQLRAAYSPSWTDYTSNLNVTTGIQQWTVPATGSYSIVAYGARGGTWGSETVSNNRHGKGAKMQGTFTLTKGEILKIAVGQLPTDIGTSSSHAGYGGGGTGVIKSPYNTNASILVIAGGGGGAGRSYANSVAAGHGLTSTQGGYNFSTHADSSGNGGKHTHSAGDCGWSGGGGGFFTNGWAYPSGQQNSQSYYSQLGSNPGGGISFTNGGLGATRGGCGPSDSTVQGGFGCGGGGSGTHGGGGGGGYSGGSGSHYTGSGAGGVYGVSGGGGSSYNSGSSQSNTAGVNNDAGYVVITKL